MSKRTFRHAGLVAAVLSIAAAFMPWQAGAAGPGRTAAATASLSQAEADSLLFMREEEKLARDVYRFFFTLYGDRTFYNIAQSEERHTSQVKALLDTYKLPDPAAGAAPGVFRNPTLQALYDTLVSQGSASLRDALYVGGLIEEKDIRDIATALGFIDNGDIVTVYANLIDGSANHLASFVTRIENIDGAYVPQILGEDEFNALVN